MCVCVYIHTCVCVCVDTVNWVSLSLLVCVARYPMKTLAFDDRFLHAFHFLMMYHCTYSGNEMFLLKA